MSHILQQICTATKGQDLGPAFRRHLLGSAGAASAQNRRRTVAELLELAEAEETHASQRRRSLLQRFDRAGLP